VQGEGPFVGSSTLFVRFARCDLRCRWCDTPQTWNVPRTCRFETQRGSQCFRTVENPVNEAEVIEACEALELSRHRFVSFTGGEPLLQPEAVARFAIAFRARGPQVHLETHGVAPDELAAVIASIDVVSMDWKFGSDVAWAEQGAAEGFSVLCERSLRVAKQAPQVYVKAVISPNTTDAEFDEMCERIAGVDRRTPLVLQPVTPHGKLREGAAAGQLLRLLLRAEERLEDVRVIPQTHKLYGVL